jgi:CRISPR/Cas system CMR-associated protein Cmr1 (group 7 of RAMP superfamily)
MKLEPINHHLEILTPAWLGGASPSVSAEVRGATIRGHLRQWLRILHPDAAYDEAIFGRMAGEGHNAAAASSRVVLHLTKPAHSQVTKNLASYLGVNDERDALHHPESYFLWPLRTQSRGVLLPGASSEFTLTVRWFPTPANRNQNLLPIFAGGLRAFMLLGCIGTRATRGYGSVWEKGRNIKDVAHLQQELSFLPPSVSVLLLDGEFDDGRKALAAAASWMRSYRVGSHRFGNTVDEAVNDHNVADPEQTAHAQARVYRQVLGMPLAQRFNRGRDNTVTITSKHRHDGAETDRYPSPMRIKVIRMGRKFRVLVVLLRPLLLPERTRIFLSNRPTRTAELSHQLLDRMMKSGTHIR